MTCTFNPEFYGQLLARYQPKRITTEEENEQAVSEAMPEGLIALDQDVRTSSESNPGRGNALMGRKAYPSMAIVLKHTLKSL